MRLDTQRDYEKQLQSLYARRSAIDNLIASLETYDRYRATPEQPGGQRKYA